MEYEEEESGKATKPDGFVGERMTVLPKDVVAKYAENVFVKRLYLTDVGYFPDAKGHFIDRPDGVDEYIYFYCVAGTGTIVIGGKSFTLHKDMAICIPQHSAHSNFSSEDDPWSILWVHFNGEDARCYPIEHVQPVTFRSAYSSNRMLFLFNQLFDVVESPYSMGNFIYMSHTLQMILSETYFKDDLSDDLSRHNDYLNAIIKYLHANISRNLTLQELCDEFNLSKSYLNALFKKNMHTSPINYFISIKMKEACRMLRSTNDTVKIIAANLGYYDSYYFSFLFKKTVGVSPTDYRSSNMIFSDLQNAIEAGRRGSFQSAFS